MLIEVYPPYEKNRDLPVRIQEKLRTVNNHLVDLPRGETDFLTVYMFTETDPLYISEIGLKVVFILELLKGMNRVLTFPAQTTMLPV